MSQGQSNEPIRYSCALIILYCLSACSFVLMICCWIFCPNNERVNNTVPYGMYIYGCLLSLYPVILAHLSMDALKHLTYCNFISLGFFLGINIASYIIHVSAKTGVARLAIGSALLGASAYVTLQFLYKYQTKLGKASQMPVFIPVVPAFQPAPTSNSSPSYQPSAQYQHVPPPGFH